MDNKKLITQIGNLIDKKLKPITNHLDAVEMKVEIVNKKVEGVEKKIEQAQEETIDTLSELINTGYNLHEKRIKKIENHLGFTSSQ